MDPSATDSTRDRKKRGVTLKRQITLNRSQGKKMVVEYNDRGQPVGEGAIHLHSYEGVLARQMVPIVYANWKQVPPHIKEEIWDCIEGSFVVDTRSRHNCMISIGSKWRHFKHNLYVNHIQPFKDEPTSLKEPPAMYSHIDRGHWDAFVLSRTSPEFERSSASYKALRAKHVYPHRLSRKGYAHLHQDLKMKGDLPIDADRSFFWKKARMGKDGNYSPAVIPVVEHIDELQSQSSVSLPRRDPMMDILSEALGNPEHPGSVRGMGKYVTPRSYFHTVSGPIKDVVMDRRVAELEALVRQLTRHRSNPQFTPQSTGPHFTPQSANPPFTPQSANPHITDPSALADTNPTSSNDTTPSTSDQSSNPHIADPSALADTNPTSPDDTSPSTSDQSSRPLESFSILSDDKEVFKQEFEIEKRELRAATRVPESGNAGSQLENVVFEIVNSEGDVDQTFHDEDEYGKSHTLTIKSETFNEYEFVHYAFKNGRCTVPAMPLPQSAGVFVFVASHSRYPELSFSFKVNVTQVPNLEHDGILSPSLGGKMLHLPDSSPIKNDFMVSILNEKVLQDDMCKVGLRIGDHERQLKVLNNLKVETVQAIIELEASVENCYLTTKEEIMKQIENTGHSAATLCSLSRRIPFQEPEDHLMKDIVGLVAILGTVCNNNLSRILAGYLGLEKMLAVVCRSDAATCALEKSLYAEAAPVARPLNGQFLVICLDDIRPYAGEFERNDPQRKLTLENPTLPSGNIPPGFLGYAVNLINLDVHHLHTRTAAGHGLRETLFYNLFGELQVYETREQMVEAHACINNGAVSLDGRILRERGIKSLGYGIPEVCFPVITSDVQMHLSPVEMEILKEIEENKLKLRSIVEHIERGTIAHEKSMKKFKKKEKKFHKLMDSLEAQTSLPIDLHQI